MYGALGITSAVYVLIAIGVFGTLTVAEVIRYGETAIAEAARPGARRRRLHGHGRRRAALDRRRDQRDALRLVEPDRDAGAGRAVPVVLRARVAPRRARPGCSSPAALVLVVANLVDLSAIASVGSAVALMIFLLVGVAGYRRRADTGSKPRDRRDSRSRSPRSCSRFFAVDTLRNAPETFTAMLMLGLLAIVFDAVWRARRPDRTDAGGLQDFGASGSA